MRSPPSATSEPETGTAGVRADLFPAGSKAEAGARTRPARAGASPAFAFQTIVSPFRGTCQRPALAVDEERAAAVLVQPVAHVDLSYLPSPSGETTWAHRHVLEHGRVTSILIGFGSVIVWCSPRTWTRGLYSPSGRTRPASSRPSQWIATGPFG